MKHSSKYKFKHLLIVLPDEAVRRCKDMTHIIAEKHPKRWYAPSQSQNIIMDEENGAINKLTAVSVDITWNIRW